MSDQQDIMNHDLTGESGTGAGGRAVKQVLSANHHLENPTNRLMEKMYSIRNLKHAFKAVKRNKGAPGIDAITIDEISENLDEHLEKLHVELKRGTFRPAPVRQIEIEKPDGGMRILGIPNVIDRWVAQAIVQVINPIFDPTFSEFSFGFRPKRNAIGAINQAKTFVKQGKEFVVDIDLEKFFDNVCQDKLMALVAKRLQDKCLLRLIRRFLRAGVMADGEFWMKEQGTVQGSPLSPILSNIMLHQLDLELEKRGHSFCRYADDCQIYVQSPVAAKRVLNSITKWIEKHLKLKVNQTKSAAERVQNRKFLGINILPKGLVRIAKPSVKRFKDKIRKITKRNRGKSLDQVIKELNPVVRGWFHYFKCSSFKTIFKNLDAWLRRRLRCYRLKQRKRKYAIKTFLQSRGIDQQNGWALAGSDKGWWRKALNPVAHRALPKQWFKGKGLFCLYDRFVQFQSETALCDNARRVV